MNYYYPTKNRIFDVNHYISITYEDNMKEGLANNNKSDFLLVGGKSPQNWIYVRQFCAKTRLKSTLVLEMAGFSAKMACRNSIEIFSGHY